MTQDSKFPQDCTFLELHKKLFYNPIQFFLVHIVGVGKGEEKLRCVKIFTIPPTPNLRKEEMSKNRQLPGG